MKRKEFLSELEKKLHLLEEAEIKDIINEYKDHIDEKIKSGQTEEEAISDFGDINDLVDEILSAYKINTKYNKNSEFNRNFDNFISKVVAFFKDIAKKLEQKDSKEIIDLIVKIVIILVLLGLLQIPLHILNNAFTNFLYNIPVVSEILIVLWRLLSSVLGIVIWIVLLFYGIKYLLNKELNVNGKSISEHIDEEIKKEQEKQSKPNKKEEKIYENKTNSEQIRNNDETRSVLYITFSIILKFFAIIFNIGFITIIVGLSVALAVIIGLMFSGVFLIEIAFVLLGLIIIFGSLVGITNHVSFKVVR
jgi:Predicted membrane protein